MTTNVAVVAGDPPARIGSTYPRRARQLVRKGRAAWVDDVTIRLHAAPPHERLDGMDTVSTAQTDWVSYFQQLVESTIKSDHVAEAAAEAIAGAWNPESDPSITDQPGLALARIIEANCQMKVEALRVLSDFVLKMSATKAGE